MWASTAGREACDDTPGSLPALWRGSADQAGSRLRPTALALQSLWPGLIDWACGGRDQGTLDRLSARLERWGVRLYCTDDYGPYDQALPAGRHYIGTDETVLSEGNHARLRHWFARFRRRTVVVSRSAAMVDRTVAPCAHYHCNDPPFGPA